MKDIRPSLPNIITLFNLSLGVVAIMLTILASESNNNVFMMYASLLILLAALADRFDGKVARKLGVESELGKELDSLSDLISFGVAPVIIAWKTSFIDLDIIGYIFVLAFPIAGAYRLARFNVEEFGNVFMGMPITLAGAFLSILNIYNYVLIDKGVYTSVHKIVAVIIVLLLSYLMVSKIQIKKR